MGSNQSAQARGQVLGVGAKLWQAIKAIVNSNQQGSAAGNSSNQQEGEEEEEEAPQMGPAAEKVLNMTELLVMVLLHCDEETILHAQRVNCKFRDVISETLKLQQRLWLQPDDSLRPEEGTKTVFINPILFNHRRATGAIRRLLRPVRLSGGDQFLLDGVPPRYYGLLEFFLEDRVMADKVDEQLARAARRHELPSYTSGISRRRKSLSDREPIIITADEASEHSSLFLAHNQVPITDIDIIFSRVPEIRRVLKKAPGAWKKMILFQPNP
ncbi:Hypothetical predicted protein [Lecanosticta acicola]|uniref:F-box domain-containing protein n=1 Tax=Lecanosticta acicola TaxID=111012 RepID=A0AAI8YU47_9PEZI|nr:Hypothetical predicted protein [Lecanosticta acicola]